jgi:hypothetical protein
LFVVVENAGEFHKVNKRFCFCCGMDLEFVGQLVGSMKEGVLRLEKAVGDGDKVSAAKLKVLVLDMQKKLGENLKETRR